VNRLRLPGPPTFGGLNFFKSGPEPSNYIMYFRRTLRFFTVRICEGFMLLSYKQFFVID